MKKLALIFLLILFIGIAYFYIKEISYSPLKEKDFQKLFFNYDENKKAKKKCSIDFLGFNIKNEVFEFYTYKVKGGAINANYPDFKHEWENKKIPNNIFISKWKKCPLDSFTMDLYKFTLTANNFNEKKCCRSFDSLINNNENYYSYIHFNELEQYFFLYCPDNEYLYYIRRRGF